MMMPTTSVTAPATRTKSVLTDPVSHDPTPEGRGASGFDVWVPVDDAPNGEADELGGVDVNGHICMKQGTFSGKGSLHNGKTDSSTTSESTADVL
jgi:hypothetical protein